MPTRWRTSLVATIALFGATTGNGCSSNHEDYVVCPAAGTYVLHVTADGQWIYAQGVLQPLIESALGSCALNDPPDTNCTPAAVDVTFTIPESGHEDGTLQPIAWTSSLGESGTCSLTFGAAEGIVTDGTGTSPPNSECSYSAQHCAGGSIDSLGLTFDLGGMYGHAIAAGVSRNGCCYQGTAQKQ